MKIYKFAKLQARHYPTYAELLNPYIYGRVDVVINVSESEWPPFFEEALILGLKRLAQLPLNETGTDMGLENILQSVRILEEADREGLSAIVHCDFGNNRSRVVAECFHYRKLGFQLEDPYKGAINHLVYNCSIGLLPPIEEMEIMIQKKCHYTASTT